MWCYKCRKDHILNRYDEETQIIMEYCPTCEKRKEERAKLSKDERNKRKRHNDYRRQKAQQFIVDYLRDHHCVDCGEADIVVLDFDHLRDKEYNISRMVSSGKPIASIIREIEKCVVRCANCHRRKTAKENGSYRLRAINGNDLFIKGSGKTSHSSLNKDIAKIREEYNAGNTTYKALAIKYGVSRYVIGDIIRYKTWK